MLDAAGMLAKRLQGSHQKIDTSILAYSYIIPHW